VKEVAAEAEDWNSQEQQEPSHLKPDGHCFLQIQTLHYMRLLARKQRVHDVPQMMQHYPPNDCVSVDDQRFERKLRPHITKEVDTNASGVPSVSVSKIPS
jgi:hypothetical protein